MKIAIGSDEKTALTDFVVSELKSSGIDTELYGALADNSEQWTDVAAAVAERVSAGSCDQGILFCWTGTGVSIAANKVTGVRAALCTDAETASGARKWNDANILALSLRLITPTVAKEILDAWFSAEVDESEQENINKLDILEQKYNKTKV
ncbi:MAG: RpiB/LacA/LacB family sugar-phosphate isomerase [Candidatus Dadabacteria bacterium]|nr:RpiB/LacA/LacB family sugar-phosphate isomerase [Candidatus Dadabacteria bacterium]NIS09230.1 RpiB/LacA/LacB family sugar-phosphate isomerase [Candidatus Dadabacteria bacterium]NIV42514.1 RpiB/LacA/LacB family sugar-phosphate isomerase [Candidatus Dadabacteria bacterium]NIY22506.1 RpiB/LacA/LacB family sugar-phosphate isomerase [Candidatus Dadabacteria bacterium]